LPPVAVVTAKASIMPDSPLITDALVPTIVLTCEAAPQQSREALAEAGADVVVVGDELVDPVAALAELDRRGLRRVDCEGGPRLFGELITTDLVDQLCLTISPQLTAGDSGRISNGPPPPDIRRMRLASVLQDDDFLMLAYRRARA
jgi:5-amino-6-(5-phosphoribosylamino)uracil reductase